VKLLWLNAGLLLPLDKGGKLRTWHLMRHLAQRHDIIYVSFADRVHDSQHLTGMHEVCAELETIPRSDPAKGTLRFYADAARYLVDPVPYAVAKYRSAAYRSRVEALLRTRRFDAIVCDFLVPLVNLPDHLPCPAILFTHNVEAEIWRRHAEAARQPVARTLLRRQWHRMREFERAALGRFELVLAVSDADRRTFASVYPGALRSRIHVVQTGVDTEYYTSAAQEPRPAHLVFTGSMDWLPNEDGMQLFVREILPRIRESIPDATLSIIGRAPTPAVQRLAEDRGVEVTGRVDDIRPHIAAGAVYVVPLRIGGGTRLKIFEAMAMGKAVVSTTIGAEGLPVTDGRDIRIADDPASFARAVVHLIREPEERRILEAAARRLVQDRYDWSAVAVDFERALADIRQPSATSHKPQEYSAGNLQLPAPNFQIPKNSD
jgi:sugar transferase (PEP-CTERM/EpsH1 system associated)